MKNRAWLIIAVSVIAILGLLIYVSLSFLSGVISIGSRFKTFNKFAPISSAPVVYQNRVYYIAKDGYLYSLNAKNGKFKWKQKIYKSSILSNVFDEVLSSPVAGNKLVFTANGRKVFAFDYLTGAKKWEKKAPENIITYTTNSNVFYFFSNVLYTVDAKTGIDKWKFEPMSPKGWTAMPKEGSFFVDNDTLYYASDDSHAYAVDVDKRKVNWMSPRIKRMENPRVISLVVDNLLFAGSNQGLYAIDNNTGDFLWELKISGDMSAASPVVTNNLVYFLASNGKLYVVNSKTGKIKWRSELGGEGSAPIVKDNIIYFGSWDENFYAVDALNGKRKWKHALRTKPGADLTDPILVDNLIYFGSINDGNIYVLNASNGKLVWTTRDN